MPGFALLVVDSAIAGVVDVVVLGAPEIANRPRAGGERVAAASTARRSTPNAPG